VSKKIAIIYPWDDLADGRSGAASLVLLHARYLAETGNTVRILQLGTVNSREIANSIYLESYDHSRWQRPFARRALTSLLKKIGVSKYSAFHLWYFVWPLFDGDLRKRCHQVISWADEIYLEYSYFSSFVTKICKDQQKPLCILMHDIVSDTITKPKWLKHKLEKLETQHLRSATHVACLTRQDQSQLIKSGIGAFFIQTCNRHQRS